MQSLFTKLLWKHADNYMYISWSFSTAVASPVILCILCRLLHHVHINKESVEPKMEQFFLRMEKKNHG